MKGNMVFRKWEVVVFLFGQGVKHTGVEVLPSPSGGRLIVEDLLLLIRRGVDSSLVFIFRSAVIGCLLVELLVWTDLKKGRNII